MADQDLIFRVMADAKQAMSELRATSGAILGVRDATGATLTPMQALIQKTVELGAANTNARDSASAFTTGLSEEKAAFDRLRASVDPAFAATMRYKQAVNEARIAEQLGIASKQETALVLGQLTTRYEQETAAAQRSAAVVQTMGRQHRAAGFMVQNAAFQVGDFAVQVAAGTAPTRALAQQIPQLLGSFGVWGAVIGAASAVLIPLIGYLWNLKDAQAEAGKSNDAFGKSFSALKSEMEAATSLQGDYIAAVKSGNAVVIQAVKDEAAVRQRLLALDQIDLKVKQDAAASGMTAAYQELKALQDQVDARQAQLAKIQANPASDTYMNDLTLVQGLLEDENAALVVQQGLLARTSAEYELVGAQITANSAKLSITEDLLAQIAAGTVPIKDGLDDATISAGNLEKAMGGVAMAANATVAQMIGVAQAAAAAQSAAQGQAAAPHGIGPAGQMDGSTAYASALAADAAKAAAYAAWTPPKISIPSSGGGGGGGSPGEDPVQKAIDDAAKALDDFRKEQIGKTTSFANSLGGEFSSAFEALITGTQSGADAFSSMTKSILADIAKLVSQNFVEKFITPLITTGLGSLGMPIASAKGNVFAGGNVVPFAKGGIPGLSHYRNAIVRGPTMFAMGGTGVMGEAGPEAIMPLKRGHGGVLGVAGGGTNVQFNIHCPPGSTAKKTESQGPGGAKIFDVFIEAARSDTLADLARGGPISDALTRSFGAKRQGQ